MNEVIAKEDLKFEEGSAVIIKLILLKLLDVHVNNRLGQELVILPDLQLKLLLVS